MSFSPLLKIFSCSTLPLLSYHKCWPSIGYLIFYCSCHPPPATISTTNATLAAILRDRNPLLHRFNLPVQHPSKECDERDAARHCWYLEVVEVEKCMIASHEIYVFSRESICACGTCIWCFLWFCVVVII